MPKSFWFTVSFAATFGALVVGTVLFHKGEPIGEAVAPPYAEALANIAIPMSGIVSAATGDVVHDLVPTLDDAIVILLGGIGCSPSQLGVLGLQGLVAGSNTRARTTPTC